MKIIIKNMNQQKMKKINIILFIWLLLIFFAKCDADCTNLFAITDSGKQCYENESACKAANFDYKKGNQCLNYCPSYIYNPPDPTLIECLDSTTVCIGLGLKYYNTEELKCSENLPTDSTDPPYYENEHGSDDSPLPDEGGSTYTRGCKSSKFPKLTFQTQRCQRECDDGEFFKIKNQIIQTYV